MKEQLKKMPYKKIASIFAWGLVFFFIGYITTFAFVGPTSNPPGGGGAISTDASNNVGIGTATPGEALSVFGVGKTIELRNSATTPRVMRTYVDATNQIFAFGSNDVLKIGKSDPTQSLFVGGFTEYMRIDTVGNVGIANTAPGEKLDVTGNTKTSGAFIGALSGSISAANISQGVFGLNLGTFNYAFPGALAVGVNSTVGLQSNSLYVNGNVGIGTATPLSLLHLVQTVTSDPRGIVIDQYSSDSSAPQINQRKARGTVSAPTAVLSSDVLGAYFARGYDGSAFSTVQASLRMYAAENWTTLAHGTFLTLETTPIGSTALAERVRIDGLGNVGIGTTNPSYKLDVNGTLRVSGVSTLSGNIAFGGPAITNLNMNNNNIVGVNKLTVGTIDPLYEISGKKYSSYSSSIVGGTKEELVGRGEIRGGSFEIDFSSVLEGSDLWVWRHVVDFSRDSVDVLVTPYGAPALIYYVIDGEKIVFHSDRNTEFSYRLIGRRFDWRDWPTLSKDQSEKASLIIEQK